MYTVLPLTPKLQSKVTKPNLVKKYAKAIALLATNPQHPGLNVELLEPKHMNYYSFRLDRKYRGLYIVHSDKTTIQVVGITVHYH